MKHVPTRSCIVCRAVKEKPELVRVVKLPSGEIVLDETGKTPGRGAYVCKDGDCMNIAVKKHTLNRAFKTNVGTEVYETLEEHFKNSEKDHDRSR